MVNLKDACLQMDTNTCVRWYVAYSFRLRTPGRADRRVGCIGQSFHDQSLGGGINATDQSNLSSPKAITWRMDIRVKNLWCYLYRGVHTAG